MSDYDAEGLLEANDEEIAVLKKEVAQLRLRLLSAAGDDLCRLNQEEIKELSSGGVKIPPKEEFIASCERFHAQLAAGPGVLNNCLTLAQLIAENERLREGLEAALMCGLPPHDVSGQAMWQKAREALQ